MKLKLGKQNSQRGSLQSLLSTLISMFLLLTFVGVTPKAFASTPTISTSSSILNGAFNPGPIVEGIDFASDTDKFDFTVDMGTTNLEYDSVAFVDSSHVRFNLHGNANEGTITISANASAFVSLESQSSNTIEIIVPVALLKQIITFKPLAAMQVGSADQAPIVTANSGLNVVITSNTPSVCTIDFSKVHAVGAGTCSVKATQAGNSVYEAATSVVVTLLVSEEVTVNTASAVKAELSTRLSSLTYDPNSPDGAYASVLVAGNSSSSENSTLLKLLVPPQATSVKTVFLISAYSSDEETAAGYFVARVAAVSSDGSSVRRFKEPIEINFPAGAKDADPYWSYDAINWYPLQQIKTEVLPSNQHAGYFVEADGRVAFLSDYLMLFGFRKPQLPLNTSSPVEQLTVATTALVKSFGGSGSGSLRYRTSTEEVCSISQVGVVTGLSEGVCEIRATKQASGFYADARSTVISFKVVALKTAAPSATVAVDTGFLTHSLTFMVENNLRTLDVGLCSIYANETAELYLGTKGKSGSWSWKKISSTPLDENGAGVFSITVKFSAGQMVRVMVNGVIQMESDV